MNGLLLINLGTPQSCEIHSIRKYLKEFLMDQRVIDSPYWLRWLFVHGYVLPIRAKKTQAAYQCIWTPQGSPLLTHSLALTEAVQNSLANSNPYQVALGMRYGEPSIETALEALKDCTSITILPLFPQYSSAASGSALEKTLFILSKKKHIQNIRLLRDFYQEPAYINAYADHLKKTLSLEKTTHIVFSYHGLPERQNKIDASPYLDYRAQCLQTSELLASALNLETTDYTTCFQSRLGRLPWIKPYLTQILPDLRKKGIQDIAIACPSFVCDCLETLEEINIRAREEWQSLAGNHFIFIPALNAKASWIQKILYEH